MIKDFILPDIGEGIVECELVEWLIQEGDTIEEDQPVADVMTDKALVQIPAPYGGRVVKLHYAQGDIAKVHAPLFAVELGEEEGIAPPAPAANQAAEPPASQPVAPAAGGEGATQDFILPDIGEGIVECEVVEWLIQEGDHIEEDQPVVDVMTDKALVQIPAPQAGRVTRLYYAQGEIARVHAPLFAIVPDDAGADPSAGAQGAAPAPAPAVSAAQAPAVSSQLPGSDPLRHGKVPASPAVRRLAREYQLNLAEIPGSGKHGRVLKEDIQRYRDGQTAVATGGAVAEKPASPASSAPLAQAAEGEVRVVPIRGIQAAMARRMVDSVSTIPHFTFGDEVDMSALLALRAALKARAEARGIRLTLMPFFMKAMALAIQEYPILNSQVNDDCSELHYLPACNIGMAVDSKVGLLVPNVKHVERLSILQIAAEVQRLTEAAREGKVKQEDLQDGTISISNIGALGGTYAVPVINKPEVAIVALGKTQTLPRFDADGQVTARQIMAISWSGDHRVIDGGTIARFSNQWKAYLEDPASMLLDLA